MMHWAIKYIGQPWSTECDCWGFFRLVQREQFGVDLPIFSPASYRLQVKGAVFAEHQERANWIEISAAEVREGDGLLMTIGQHAAHVGIWVEVDGGRVLHSDSPRGGQLAPLDRLAEQYTTIKFYRHKVPHAAAD